MSVIGKLGVPADAAGLRLYRYSKPGGDDTTLRACEAIRFNNGAAAVDTVLRRAAISGRVEIDGTVSDHFADILDADGSIVGTVALDAKSYRALKTKWMPCRLEPTP
jgi:hypothetical protein